MKNEQVIGPPLMKPWCYRLSVLYCGRYLGCSVSGVRRWSYWTARLNCYSSRTRRLSCMVGRRLTSVDDEAGTVWRWSSEVPTSHRGRWSLSRPTRSDLWPPRCGTWSASVTSQPTTPSNDRSTQTYSTSVCRRPLLVIPTVYVEWGLSLNSRYEVRDNAGESVSMTL